MRDEEIPGFQDVQLCPGCGTVMKPILIHHEFSKPHICPNCGNALLLPNPSMKSEKIFGLNRYWWGIANKRPEQPHLKAGTKAANLD